LRDELLYGFQGKSDLLQDSTGQHRPFRGSGLEGLAREVEELQGLDHIAMVAENYRYKHVRA